MIRNFITIALRNLRRQLTYSIINIFGLAIGIACSLVIFLYVYGEWSHDHHFKNADRIYRIGVSFFNLGKFAKGPELLKQHLPKEFEAVEDFTSFDSSFEPLYVEGKLYKEVVYHIDSSFFSVFSHTFIQGNADRAMVLNNSIVITEKVASKLFAGADAIGKTIEVGKEKIPHVVTGVVKDEQHKSHLKTSVWIARKTDNADDKLYWPSASVYNYVLLKEQASEAGLHDALTRIIEKYIYPASGLQGSVSLEHYMNDENSVKFYVHPLKDIYLKSELSFELSPGANETNLYIFAVVACFILVLAGVNFVNLTTARATRRAKEVGVRKSLGTSRGKLVVQFLMESVMISVVAMVIALGFAELFLLSFYWITGQSLLVELWSGLNVLLALVFAIVIGLLAGIYPAFYLTSFVPVKVLKGLVHSPGGSSFRNGLVVFQFVVSISLIICTGVIIQQLYFMRTKDLGFNQQNLLTIDNVTSLKAQGHTFKDYLLQHSGVVSATLHAGEPGRKSIMLFYTYQTPEMPNRLTINTYLADYDYIDVLGFRLLKGRDFDRALASDSSSVIINEAAARALNLGDDPIGKEVNKGQKVIGVVSDFHWESLRNTIAPVVIMLHDKKMFSGHYAQLTVRFQNKDVSSLIRKAEQKWKELATDESMEYHFMDENFAALARKDETLGKAIGFFAGLAILISCLGVLGLAAYTTEQRRKEIGIRKVFGASLARIYVMINSQYVKLMVVAMLVSIPLTWWVMQQWLDTFSYKVQINPLLFIVAGGVEFVAALACVGYLAFRAASLNPSNVLKEE